MPQYDDWNAERYIESIKPYKGGKPKYQLLFEVLSDQQFHCRECANRVVNSKQIAGSGGITRLEKGAQGVRPGLKIESRQAECVECGNTSYCDRWTGEFVQAGAPQTMSAAVINRVLSVYGNIDVIENRERADGDLVVDHKFPDIRKCTTDAPYDANMPESEIRRLFQLLKKDEGGNHNKLKSEACLHCFLTGMRGTPMNIRFWYEGSAQWDDNIPTTGLDAERGCVGCGWYDFAAWREALNRYIGDEE